MERNSFMFYRSFYGALKACEAEDRLALYDAIAEYAFLRKEPNFQKSILKMAWVLIHPVLESGWRNYLNSLKGGAPIGNSNASKQPKNKPKTTEKQPTPSMIEEGRNKREEVRNKNKDVDCIILGATEVATPTPTPKKRFTPPSVQDVDVFAHEFAANNGLQVPPTFSEGFVDYYTANGWKAGRNPMRDWRAACRRWLRDNTNNNSHGNNFNRPSKAQLNADAVREVEKQLADILA